MIILKDEISSQENMEAWLSQLGHPDNPISNNGVLKDLKPRFVSCDFAEKKACFAFDALDWELNPGGSLHGGIIVTGEFHHFQFRVHINCSCSNLGGEFSHTDQFINREIPCKFSYLSVIKAFILSQFKHVGKNSDSSSGAM